MYRVLIIEDEKLIRKWLRFGFDYESINCVVIGEASDGEEGIELINSLKPDIVITDINMPRKDAFQMLEETKYHIFSKIIVSGYNDFPNAKKAISYDAVEFIVKPINESELKDAILKARTMVDILKLEQKEKQKINEMIKGLANISFEVHYDHLVKQMIQYIEKNYAKKFTFNEVSNELGYSSSLLYKKFKEETKQTFNEYLNQYRIKKSIEEVQRGEYKIYQIAEKVGFTDYKYFNQVFKKYTGYTCTEFLERK
ncbi:response regulator [Niallia alba]|uniref:Response regulator n=1 Tax=Niallia circulans TaxID=1397 RepID=A0A941JIK0_NIACI|nr:MULTISPECIES: response regulator [Niallia]MCB5237346.1 response regulator [Niallia circulans]MDU1846547.1 response regulator [Niallia nealsonii]MED3792714.1 response regulator [Niallia alba]